MAALKLHRTDGGVSAISPNDILDRMKVGEGDTLDIHHTLHGILLTPDDSPHSEIMRVARQIMDENAAVLSAFAK